MAYNANTQEKLLTFRMTARQAVPRNVSLAQQRSLHVTRHAFVPSNDEGLKFDRLNEVIVDPNEPVVPEGFVATVAQAWDNFTTHAEYDQFINDNTLSPPDGWYTTFKLVDKKAWLEAQV